MASPPLPNPPNSAAKLFPIESRLSTLFPSCLRALNVTLRDRDDTDQPFLFKLYTSFRAEELEALPWSAAQRAVFLRSQFSLQSHHFANHFPGADFWIVQQTAQNEGLRPVGRFYLDRSTSVWRAIDLGFLPEWRAQGIGSALLRWVQNASRAAGAGGVDLHVLDANHRAEALYSRLGFQPDGVPDGQHRRMVWRP